MANFSENVAIIWDVSQPLGQIKALEERLTALDSRLNTISTTTVANFATSFLTATGRINTGLDETIKKLETISKLSMGGGSPPPPGRMAQTASTYSGMGSAQGWLPMSIGAAYGGSQQDIENSWAAFELQLAESQARQRRFQGAGGRFIPRGAYSQQSNAMWRGMGYERMFGDSGYPEFGNIWGGRSEMFGSPFDFSELPSSPTPTPLTDPQLAEWLGTPDSKRWQGSAQRLQTTWGSNSAWQAQMASQGVEANWSTLRGLPRTREDPLLASTFAQAADQRRLRTLGESAMNQHEGQAGLGQAEQLGGPQASSAWDRHFQHILRGIVLWGAMNTAIRVASDGIREYVNFADVSARTQFTSGDGYAENYTAFRDAASYGVDTQYASQGIVAASQLGVGPQGVREGAQLAMVFGQQTYVNSIIEMEQTRRRANSAGLEEIQIMDYIATAYSQMPGSLEVYMDSLQQGIELTKVMGMETENIGLVLSRISGMEAGTPEATATLLYRIQANLQNDEIKRKLGTWGVSGDSQQMMQQIAQVVTYLNQQGKESETEKFYQLILGGALQAGMKPKLATVFGEFYKEMADPSELKDMQELLDLIGESGSKSIDRLTASWNTFLQAVANTGPIAAAIDALDTISLILRAQNATTAYDEMTPGQQKDVDAYMAAKGFEKTFDKDTGYEWTAGENVRNSIAAGLGEEIISMTKTGNLPIAGGMVAASPLAYQQLVAQAKNVALASSISEVLKNDNSKKPPIIAGFEGFTIGEGKDGTTDLGDMFGGFREAPEKPPWDEFVAKVKEYEEMIKTTPGLEYSIDQKQYAFWDDSINNLRLLVADSNAIRFATDETRKLLSKDLQGVFNVPAGGDALVSFNALANRIGPDYLLGAGGGTKAGARPTPYDDDLIDLKSGRLDDLDSGGYSGSASRASGKISMSDELRSRRSAMELYREGERRYFGSAAKRDNPFQDSLDIDRKLRDPSSRMGQKQESSSKLSATINSRINIQIDGRTIMAYINKQMTYGSYNKTPSNPSALLVSP